MLNPLTSVVVYVMMQLTVSSKLKHFLPMCTFSQSL